MEYGDAPPDWEIALFSLDALVFLACGLWGIFAIRRSVRKQSMRLIK